MSASGSIVTSTPDGAPRLADRMRALSGEGALDVLTRAQALEAAGRRVAHLELGEPDAPTPPHVVEAGVRALRDGETRYTAPSGLRALREAIAADAATRGIPVAPDQVLVTPGAKPAVFYAALSVIGAGDEVLVPDPGFPIYPSVTRFAGGVPVPYALRADAAHAPDVDDIAARITPRTRVLVLNAPHNPTGGSVDDTLLQRVAELVERHDLTVITDDVYARISYDAPGARTPSLAALPGLARRTIVVDGFSKAYCMTGWRLGFLLLPPDVVERVTTLAVNGHTCTPAFVQRAGIAALTGPQDALHAMVAELRRRRDRVVGALNAIPGITCATPAGAFYAFPDISAVLARHALTTDAFAARLLEEYGVAGLTGTAFGAGGTGHLRFSFAAAPETLTFALDGLAAYVAALDGAGARGAPPESHDTAGAPADQHHSSAPATNVAPPASAAPPTAL